ncbi:MAG TPA: hypothetical protein VM689_09305 [Aliidongia sp.]|nr:hypothetical protein [Aliidongia sp.]
MSNPSARLVQDSVTRIQRNPNDLPAWSQLFMVFAQARDHANLQGLVTARQQALGDGLGFYYYVMRDLLALRQDQVALEVIEQIPAGHVLAPVGLYMRGLAAARLERSDEAVALIRRAVEQFERPDLKAYAARDKLFNDYASRHMATEAGLLLDAEEVRALGAAPAEPPPELSFHGEAPPGAGPVLLAACDKGYFSRFGDGLIQSVAAATGGAQLLHLHIVGPDAATERQIAALTAAHPFLRISTEPGEYRAAYYACSRFLVLRQLLDRYRRLIVATDVDIRVLKPLDGIARAMAGADLGWFEGGKQLPLPTLFCDCRLTAFADTAASRHVLDLFEHYIRGKYAEGSKWMIDQGGLWSLSRALGPSLRRVDLGRSLGPDYDGVLVPVEEQDTKLALRDAANQADAPGSPQ